MAEIPEFTETELWIIRTTLKERYGRDVAVERADVELRLNPPSPTLTPCPAVFWSMRGANFVIAKTGEEEYFCQFYYRGFEQFGTGRSRYNNVAECVTAVLQAQADHERSRAVAGRDGSGD